MPRSTHEASVAVAVPVACFLVAFAATRLFRPASLTLLLVPLALAAFHLAPRWKSRAKGLVLGLLVGMAAISAAGIGREIHANLARPSEWDFLSFYIYGQAAARGLDVYDPAVGHLLADGLETSAPFRREILDVGFWYPPPTILLVLPLGQLDVRSALTLWYGVQLAALIGSVLLLQRLFAPGDTGLGLWLVAALTLTFAPTRSTFQYAQTNTLALLALVLYFRDARRGLAGVWLVSGAVVKPFIAVLGLDVLFRRNTRALVVGALAAAVLSGVTIALFGLGPFARYLEPRRLSGMAPWIYTEGTNQSLLSVLLRLSIAGEGGGVDYWQERAVPPAPWPLNEPAYMAMVAFLGIVTLWLSAHPRALPAKWKPVLLLLFALLVYPSSQYYYGLLLVVPMLMAWSDRQGLPGGVAAVVALVWLQFLLAALHGGHHLTLAYMLDWSLLSVAGVVRLRQGRSPPGVRASESR